VLPSHSALHFLRIGSAKTDGAILNLPPPLGLGSTAEAPVELLLLLLLLLLQQLLPAAPPATPDAITSCLITSCLRSLSSWCFL
jgi:hypothetical protein